MACWWPVNSLWIVNFNFILREWGSVHLNAASISFTLLSPFIYLRQSAIISLDSRSIAAQGGRSQRLHILQKLRIPCFVIPSVTSVLFVMHLRQIFVLVKEGLNDNPHIQQRILVVFVDRAIKLYESIVVSDSIFYLKFDN